MKINYFGINEAEQLDNIIDLFLGITIALTFWPVVLYNSGNFFIGYTLFLAQVYVSIIVFLWWYTKRIKLKIHWLTLLFILPLVISNIYALDKINTFIIISQLSFLIIITASLTRKINVKYLTIGLLLTLPLHFLEGLQTNIAPGWDGFTNNRAVFAALLNLTGAFILSITNKHIYFLPGIVIRTFSRTGFGVSILLVIFITFINIKNKQYKSAFIGFSIFLIISSFSFLTIPSTQQDRFESTNPSQRYPSTALDAIQDANDYKFLLGVGFGNATLLDNHFTHIIPIHLYTELGIFTIFIIFGILYLFYKTKSPVLLVIIFTSLLDPMFVLGTWAIPTATAVIIGLYINQLQNKKVEDITKNHLSTCRGGNGHDECECGHAQIWIKINET